jgi:hypothetical protein
MGQDSDRAALIHQHATRHADRKIADALDTRIKAERPDDDDGLADALVPAGQWHVNGTNAPSTIRAGAFWLAEPRGFDQASTSTTHQAQPGEAISRSLRPPPEALFLPSGVPRSTVALLVPSPGTIARCSTSGSPATDRHG